MMLVLITDIIVSFKISKFYKAEHFTLTASVTVTEVIGWVNLNFRKKVQNP